MPTYASERMRVIDQLRFAISQLGEDLGVEATLALPTSTAHALASVDRMETRAADIAALGAACAVLLRHPHLIDGRDQEGLDCPA